MLYKIFNFSIHKENLYLHFSCAFINNYNFIIINNFLNIHLYCHVKIHYILVNIKQSKFFLSFLFACNQG